MQLGWNVKKVQFEGTFEQHQWSLLAFHAFYYFGAENGSNSFCEVFGYIWHGKILPFLREELSVKHR